ncbi:MAG: EthD family reductase [Rhodospirillales bacterium]|nr:EthD family reductase [Rhodospirillales bacterium]MDE0381431.1 EthD family reductase [Rhodospirillales bacterium]
MAVTLAMQYPAESGSSFDWDYFLNQHVPLIETALDVGGTDRIEVALGLTGAAPGEPAAYQAVLLVDFDSITAFYHRWRQEQHRIMSDIANFTNTQPEVQLSEVIARPGAKADAPS